MDDGSGSATLLGTGALALGCYLGAVLMAGLLTAFHRLSGLHHNGLLEAARFGTLERRFLAEPRRFQVTVSTLYLAATALGVHACGSLLAAVWADPAGARFQLALAVIVVLAWTLGTLLAKMIAVNATLGYVRFAGAVVWPFTWLLRPWSALLLLVMDRFDDTLWAADVQPLLSTGEIRNLIREDEDEVDLDVEEREMIRSIFNFHDTAVREIMVPRIDVVAFELNAPLDEVIATVNACRHSRLPVFEGSVDKVVGVLYAKDLLDLVRDGRLAAEGRALADLMRPAYFIPESKKIDEVLDEFRAKRNHMAVVIDEYGGTAGIVTLEDVLEEIVGEIEDEFDEDETLYEWLDESSLRVDPKIDLEDLEDVLGRRVGTAADESSETLGGLIYEAAGSVPAAGDAVIVAGLEVTVEKVEDQRILQAVIRAREPLPGWRRARGEDGGEAVGPRAERTNDAKEP
ncbi:MAG TPA: hemolysin family protein [Candidatus Krumholzibacteria bacterium]|nr:hemolysin family protein [Candidatus Krumholzibacteria bacterium]HPD71240.1 hemolysin family protein [Candidatus Krumholzibacteria bacterium]HRY39060.1 hemolysin family protein [Candidatus Krumholzibacteria bacterium]